MCFWDLYHKLFPKTGKLFFDDYSGVLQGIHSSSIHLNTSGHPIITTVKPNLVELELGSAQPMYFFRISVLLFSGNQISKDKHFIMLYDILLWGISFPVCTSGLLMTFPGKYSSLPST